MTTSYIEIVKPYSNQAVSGLATTANNLGDNMHIMGMSLLFQLALTERDDAGGMQTAQIKLFFDKIKAKSKHRAPFKQWIEANSPLKITEEQTAGKGVSVSAKGWSQFVWDLDAAHAAPHHAKKPASDKVFDLDALTKYLTGKNDSDKSSELVHAATKRLLEVMAEEFASELAK